MSEALGGRTVLVTGANTGIGRVTALELGRRGAQVILACRSAERAKPVLEEIAAAGGKAELLVLDLGDLAAVRASATSFLDSGRPLHLLVNNAGLAGAKGATKDGFEIAFGTNHLGPYLLTRLLLPRLREAGQARIVNVSSKSHYRAQRIDYDAVRRPTASATGLPEYEASKLANVLFTKSLAAGEAGPGVRSYALHPGVIASDVWRSVPWPFRSLIKLFMKSNEDGAKTTLYCATSPEVAEHDGRYYDECKERRPNRVVSDAMAKELWDRSADLVGEHLR